MLQKKESTKEQTKTLWDTFEYFSGYGFNKSHAVGYSILSYQCAWLLNYHPAQWLAAFLNKEPESRKERAINVVKTLGYEIQEVNINLSGRNWEVSPDWQVGSTLNINQRSWVIKRWIKFLNIDHSILLKNCYLTKK